MKNVKLTNNKKLFITLLSLFFIWGFITLMNDLLLPILKEKFHLTYFQAMFINFCFFIAYGVFSIPSSYFLKKTSYKITMISGLIIISIGALMMNIVYEYNNYYIFLSALTVIALGVIFLQVSANPLINSLGNTRTASSRLTLAQGINSLGYIIAPLIFAHIILENHIPTIYSIMLTFLIIISILLSFVNFHNNDTKETVIISNSKNQAIVYLGVACIFFYVGAEVSSGSLIINFAVAIKNSTYTIKTATNLLIIYWGGAMIGRILGSILLKKYSPSKVLSFFCLINLFLTCSVILINGSFSLYSLLALGLFNSIMFPTIFSLTLTYTPKHLKEKTTGYLITAIVGGAFIPLVQGKIADYLGLQMSFYVLLPCYFIILFFSLICTKKTNQIY
jgi:FHS family L-fucose permease-like MFS transporter